MTTVLKALQLLDLFTRTRPQIGLSELARLAGQNKATCFRLMADLCDAGFAEQTESGREYRLGPALLRLATLREANVPMRDVAIPTLQELALETGETAHLSLMIGGDLRPLAHVYSPIHASKITLEDVQVFPFHATSSGMAVLAHQPPAFREAVLSRPLPALTAQTQTDPAALRDHLRQIEDRGIAESQGGYETDVHSFAVPLFDALGRCTGALAIAALANRVTPENALLIRRGLVRAARRIITLWGGALPHRLDAIWTAVATAEKEST